MLQQARYCFEALSEQRDSAVVSIVILSPALSAKEEHQTELLE